MLLKETVSGEMEGMLGCLEVRPGRQGRVRFEPPASRGCCLPQLPDGEVLGPLARKGLALGPVLRLGRNARSLG